MKFYTIALLIAAVSADQAEIDALTNGLVNDVTSETSQEKGLQS